MPWRKRRSTLVLLVASMAISYVQSPGSPCNGRVAARNAALPWVWVQYTVPPEGVLNEPPGKQKVNVESFEPSFNHACFEFL